MTGIIIGFLKVTILELKNMPDVAVHDPIISFFARLHILPGGYLHAFSGFNCERDAEVQPEFLREHLCTEYRESYTM